MYSIAKAEGRTESTFNFSGPRAHESVVVMSARSAAAVMDIEDDEGIPLTSVDGCPFSETSFAQQHQ